MSVLSVDEDDSLISDADISESCDTHSHIHTHTHTFTTDRARRNKHTDTRATNTDEKHTSEQLSTHNTDMHSQNGFVSPAVIFFSSTVLQETMCVSFV